MKESTRGMAKLTCVVSTVLTIILLGLYASKRSANIPLTYLTPFSDWSAIKRVFYSNVSYTRLHPGYQIDAPSWDALAGAAWCRQPTDSPQCACLYTYYHTSFPVHVAGLDASNLTISQFYDASYQGALGACLRERPTWRKDTCNTVCSVHLATPVMLICLFASLFLSRVTEFNSHLLNLLTYYTPFVLAVLMFVLLLVFDGAAGGFACLAILCVLVEISYICPCADSTAVYYSYQRFFLGTLASWAAVTHQARDLYLAPAYGFLGFFMGIFAYYACLVRDCPGPIARALTLYLWVGIVVILACLVLLVQQNWLPSSPVSSSVVSVAALFTVCAQCAIVYSDQIQMTVGLAVVCLCFLAVAVDLA